MATINIDEQLLLRTWQTEDAEALFEAIHKDRQHLSPWLAWVATTTRPEHTLEFIKTSQAQIRDQEALPLGIFNNGNIIGSTGMHNWCRDTNRAQIGYWIDREHEGKGIVTRSLTALINYLFGNVGLNKVEIHFIKTNVRSARLAARLGFQTEGIIRNSVLNNGMAEDLIITGMLRNEWQAART